MDKISRKLREWENLRHPGSKNLLLADFHLEFHNYTPPIYTRWMLKLNFFDVCYLTYAGLSAQLDMWSLQYGRRELLPALCSECMSLDPVLIFEISGTSVLKQGL